MEALGKLVVLLVISIMLSAGALAATASCGVLDENLLYNWDTTTEPKEYSWMGVLFEYQDNSLINTRCSVIIVSEKHVLTPGSCARTFGKRAEVLSVRLGMWNESHTPGARLVCNEKGFCVPGPVDYQVKRVLLHPSADKDTGDYDLAILELQRPIEWTRYIQPLCLEQGSKQVSLIGRNYHFGGFDNIEYLKGKDLAFSISRSYCTELGQISTPPPATHFCAYPQRRTQFYLGAALMAINVQKDMPQNFYLAGILMRHYNNDDTTLLFFHDIRPVREWIVANMR